MILSHCAFRDSFVHQLFHTPNDLRRRHSKNGRDPDNHPYAGAVDTTLNQADVGPVQSAVESQLFLRYFLRLPDFAECSAKCSDWPGLGLDLLPELLARPLRQQNDLDTLAKILPRKILRT
jgi:hypothetical protein